MSIIILLLGLLLALCAGAVVLSSTILWYEWGNRDPALLEDRWQRDRLLFAARYLGTETFLLFLTTLLRPLGWLKRGEEREKEAVFGRTPVILLHGLFHTGACWWWLRRQLRHRGLPVFTLDLPLWRDPAPAVEQLAAKIEELAALGAQQVHLVGHSMGGLIARACLRRPAVAARVGRCILLGAPNAGSRLAPFAISYTGQLLLPGSDYLLDLNAEPPPPQVRFTAICSRHDNLVIPWESGRLEGARNVELAEVGHTTLLYHPTALEIIIDELTEDLP
ncbi:MAG: alpha/beta fold hydrolase [Desulfuromonadales bacterium]|nr:alpha/beta fold hydrolase [Desulfuromonadales bacterium]